MRIERDGEEQFRLPNDRCFGQDGDLYLTDSGMAAKDFLDSQNFAENYSNLPWNGRGYEIDPNRGTVLRTLDRDILFANGIGFGPDGALREPILHRRGLSLRCVAAASPRHEVFGNVLQCFEGDDFRGPDGMCWDDDERLYCTQRNVMVLNEDASVAERAPLERENPTNCAFALFGKTLLVTESECGRVERLRRHAVA
jgi:gluconolactonase